MVRGFDADRQEWVGSDQERRIVHLHRRDAVRQWQALLVSLTVLAVCGLGFGTWTLGWRDEPQPPVSAAVHPQQSRTPSDPGDDTPDSPSPSGPPAVPAHFQAVTEDDFSTVVPEDWERSTAQGQHGVTIFTYAEPGGGPRVIEMFQVTEPDATPASTLELAEELLSHSDGYHRNSLEDVDDRRGPATELDYSYDSDDWHMRVRVLDRVVYAGADELYAVLVRGPADAWHEQRDTQDEVLAALCFAPAC